MERVNCINCLLCRTPFAKLQISAESILTKKYKKPTCIPLTIVDPLYSTTTCGITIRIQFLYENCVFVQKSPDTPCHLDAMKIGVESGVMKEDDWDSKYYRFEEEPFEALIDKYIDCTSCENSEIV